MHASCFSECLLGLLRLISIKVSELNQLLFLYRNVAITRPVYFDCELYDMLY